ncbi:MAG: hypothetical protein PF961_13000 [Planctomycetota bacterium]|jgi:hypothetical protein|nr:hypothetical protein [Planctomycetota bacterium]
MTVLTPSRYHRDLTTAGCEAPLCAPTYCLAPDPAWAGAWTVAGDLDGDGQAELVQARVTEANDIHSTVAVSAYRLDGTVLWRWGTAGAGQAAIHSDVACQIHDWDRTGLPQVVLTTATHVVVLDGQSGAELRRFAVPEHMGDCITFAHLSGGVHDDIVVKDRYHTIRVYRHDGTELWSVHDPAGFKTAHQPRPMRMPGDSTDCLMLGYALYNGDGSLRWSLDGQGLPLGQGNGHLDCVRVLQTAQRAEDMRLVVTLCGDQGVACADGTGRVLWQHTGLHYESIRIADFGAGSPYIVVDIDHRGPNESPLHVLDGDGDLVLCPVNNS